MVKEKLTEIEKRLRKLEQKLGKDVPYPEKFTKKLKKGTDEILQILDDTLRKIPGSQKKKNER